MRFGPWFFLFRPWSYVATLVPFLLAAGISACIRPHAHDVRWGYWALGLVSGLFFQATVNLLNTWGDERSGVDDVPGAIRTTPQVHDGQVSMRALFVAALTCASVASVLGVALCFYRTDGTWRFNVPLLIAGFVGFLGSTNYSTGIKFKYRGLGVPFVSFLMGPLETFVALALLQPDRTRTLLSASFNQTGVLLAVLCVLPIAALVGVVMHGNDMRDIPTDRAAGIVTLASWLGPRRALLYYCTCHLLAPTVAVVWIVIRFLRGNAGWMWAALPLLALPLALKTIRTAVRVYSATPVNPKWRGLERASGGILLVYGVLYALSFALA